MSWPLRGWLSVIRQALSFDGSPQHQFTIRIYEPGHLTQSFHFSLWWLDTFLGRVAMRGKIVIHIGLIVGRHPILLFFLVLKHLVFDPLIIRRRKQFLLLLLLDDPFDSLLPLSILDLQLSKDHLLTDPLGTSLHFLLHLFLESLNDWVLLLFGLLFSSGEGLIIFH